jgi:hypothetical protein
MNCPHWLLALTIPFSRSDRAHTSPAGVGAGCAGGLLRTMPASLLQLPEGLGGPFRRECHCSRRVTERQRAQALHSFRAATRSPASATDRSGTPAVADGCPLERSGSLPKAGVAVHLWWPAELPAPPAGHPVLEAQRAFRPPPIRQPGRRGRALPADIRSTACHHDAMAA